MDDLVGGIPGWIAAAPGVLILGWWAGWIALGMSRRDLPLVGMLSGAMLLWAAVWFALPFPVRLPLLVPALIILVPMFRIVNQYQQGVLFRLGRISRVLGPGPQLVFPFGIDVLRRVDLRTQTMDVPKQEIITRDNVPVTVDAVVYFNVSDPVLALTKIADYGYSTALLGQTILRSVLGQHDLDDMLAKRVELNDILRRLLDEPTDAWGIKVTAVEIKAMELPESMKRAMAKQAEAERERRAKVIAAEGESQASQKLADAAHVLAKEPAAVQLRYLQTLVEIAVEKNSTIVFPIPLELMRTFLPKSDA